MDVRLEFSFVEGIIKNIDNGILCIDETGRVVLSNPAFTSISGYHSDDVLKEDVNTFITMVFGANRKEEFFEKFIVNKSFMEYNVLLCDKGSNFRPVNVTVDRFIYNSRTFYILVFSPNLQNVEEEHRLHTRVFDSVNEGILITDTNGVIISVNPSFTKITGYQEEEVIGRKTNILSSGKHSLHFYIEMWSDIHETGTWQGEIWNKRKNGELFLEYLRIDTVRDEEGNLTNYVGVFSDITKSKKNDTDLRLYSRVFENASEGVMITDTSGVIISINPEFTNTTGYTANEVIGKRPNILHSGRHERDFYITMWATIHDKGSWQGEIWNKKKSGEIYPEWLSINAVKDEDGQIINYVGIFSDITQQKRSEEELTRLAHFDNLTGLGNRFYFQKKLTQVIDEAEIRNEMVGIVFIDLNRFKLVNDTLGHAIGDQLLIIFAERLKNTLKDTAFLARLGGDEFTLIIPRVEKIKNIKSLLVKVLRSVEKPVKLEDQEIIPTCSMGVSIYPSNSNSIDKLMRQADTAMYRAKEQGKSYQFYDEGMLVENNKKIDLVNGLHKALTNKEFVIHYQPQIDINNEEVVGLEALIRWEHPQMGIVSPGEFMPLAEETGLIVPIGKWVLSTVCEQIKQWEMIGINTKVAVNLSPRQFIDDSLIFNLSRAMYKTGISPNSLELEITESISMHKVDKVIDKLYEVRSLGISVSVDDFGTGHSSLSYLKRFPVNSIKIDQSFIRNIYKENENASIVKAILDMATGLGLDVVAEGVETKNELDTLKSFGCQYVQGYLFAKPMPKKEVESYLIQMQHNIQYPKG